MDLTYATNLAADLFRVPYQGIDAINQNQMPQTVAERIAIVLKNHIALADTCLTFGQYAFGWEKLNAWVTPLRIAAIAQGLYLLQNDDDPHADTQGRVNDLILNSLNVGRAAFSKFPNVTLAFTLSDTVFRTYILVANRTALVDRVKNIYHEGFSANLTKFKDLLIEGGDYLARTILATTLIAGTYFRALMFLQNPPTLHAFKILSEIAGWVSLTAAGSLFISQAVNKIFDDMGLQFTPKRRFIELTISTIASAALTASLAVAFGRASSLSEIFKPIFTSVLVTALGCTIGYVFKTAITQVNDYLGIKDGVLRHLEEWTFTVLSSLILTAVTAKAFGITHTIEESAIIITQVAAAALSSLFIGGAGLAAGRTLFLGTPTWDEIGEWLAYIH